jgi:hypothetical protein
VREEIEGSRRNELARLKWSLYDYFNSFTSSEKSGNRIGPILVVNGLPERLISNEMLEQHQQSVLIQRITEYRHSISKKIPDSPDDNELLVHSRGVMKEMNSLMMSSS